MKFSRILASSFFAACVLATPLRAGPFTEIVAFGDSLTDTGNLFAATRTRPTGAFPPSPPYYDGRFSNGPVWIEHLAAQLGVPAPTPSLTGGTNNAWGGAETSLTGNSSRGTPNIGTQISGYLKAHTPHDGQLFVLWGGANDFLNAGQTDPTVPVDNISREIFILASAGAEYFVVPNMPPLGQTPRHVGTATEATFDDRAIRFNRLLESELDDLEGLLGITIFRFNAFGVFQRILRKPDKFGLTNVTGTALLTPNGDVAPGPVVPNPDKYLFWDAVHPTRVTHRILGDHAATDEDDGVLIKLEALSGSGAATPQP